MAASAKPATAVPTAVQLAAAKAVVTSSAATKVEAVLDSSPASSAGSPGGPTAQPSATAKVTPTAKPTPEPKRLDAHAPLAIPGIPIRISVFGGGVSGGIGVSVAGLIVLLGGGSVLTLTRARRA
jgi:hypothetical protein